MMSISLVPAIDRSEFCRQYAQTWLGKAFLLMLVYLLLVLINYPWAMETIVILAMMTAAPLYRRHILLLGTVFFWLSGFNWLEEMLGRTLHHQSILEVFEQNIVNRTIGFTVAIALCGWCYQLFTKTRLSKLSLPFFWVIGGYLVLLCVLSYLPVFGVFNAYLWMFSIYFIGFIWFLGYSLITRNNKALPGFSGQIGHYLPFWMPVFGTPIPKGAGYLAKIEARSSDELALSQLKGLKLLYWALWIYLANGVVRLFAFGESQTLVNGYLLKVLDGQLHIFQGRELLSTILSVSWHETTAPFWQTVTRCLPGNCGTWAGNWQILLVWFATSFIDKALFFHVAISIVRLAGFNALRGMNNPLASRSIADFWNRFDYYFKEMLVNLFYLPFFLKFFRQSPLLRMWSSLMVAVFAASFLYHFFWYQRFIMEQGFFQAIWGFRVEAVFGFVLANSIFISQWLQQTNPPSKSWFMVKVVRPIRVMGFFCLLWIFADARMGDEIMVRVRFFYSLFGIGI